MAKDVFSVSIFFVVLRETIEAGIIVAVLLSFVEQLMTTGQLATKNTSDPSFAYTSVPANPPETTALESPNADKTKQLGAGGPEDHTPVLHSGATTTPADVKQIVRRMRIQIWAGTLAGFILALAIGAAFIAVFYTQVRDLWSQTEEIWEGVFSIIACIIIYVMGIAFLRMDRSRIKWRYKLARAFDKSYNRAIAAHRGEDGQLQAEDDREGRSGKWALFLLPFITVLREGLEAVVFVGGVSLGLPATSIPLAVVVGLIAGLAIGYAIYRTGSTTTLHWFLIGSTTVLFLIGAGLASKGVGYFQYYVFAKGVGGDVAETGDGPGSFQVKGNVWHLTYGNPETGSATTNGGWQIFNAILGWNNTATLGSILSYIFYWLLIIVTLIYLKWEEGRVTFFGKKSKTAIRLEQARQARLDSKAPRHEVEGSGSNSVSSN